MAVHNVAAEIMTHARTEGRKVRKVRKEGKKEGRQTAAAAAAVDNGIAGDGGGGNGVRRAVCVASDATREARRHGGEVPWVDK